MALILVALLAAGISRSLVFTGMATMSYSTLSDANMTSGNVLASISMQLFNAVAISATAISLGISAQLSGHADPEMIDYRVAMGAIIFIGLAATLLARRRLPHDLREIHP